MSTETELARISQAKSDLKTAIEAKGVEVGDGRIDTYAGKVDEIAGITPTGTIEITENGEDIDVATYAKANVNVSGGGGGIPDQTFTVANIVGTSDGQSSNSKTFDLTNSTLGAIWVGYKMSWGAMDSPTTATAVFADVDSDGYFHTDITVSYNGKTKVLHQKTFGVPNSNGVYDDAINTNKNYLGGYPNSIIGPTSSRVLNKVDWDNPVESVTMPFNLTFSSTIRNGKLYKFPLSFACSELNTRKATTGYAMSQKSFNGVAQFTQNNSHAEGFDGFFHTTSSNVAGTTVNYATVMELSEIKATANYAYANANVLLINIDGQISSIGWDRYAIVWISDDVNYAEMITKLKTAYIYSELYGWEDDGVWSNHQSIIGISQQGFIDEWDEFIADDPTGEVTFTIPTKSYASTYYFRGAINQSFKLSDIVSTAQPLILSYTDTSTYETTSHPAVLMVADDLDISNLTKVYNQGGYY